jgi:hypothetical protein
MQTSSVIVRGAAATALRIAGMPVRWTAVLLSNEETAVESIVQEARSGQTGAPFQVMIAEARQGISVTEGTKACHLPEPAVVVLVVAAAAAADNRAGTTQLLFKG